LLNDQCFIDEIQEEIKSFLEVKENENMTYQNLWDKTKAVLRGKFIPMSGYIKRTESSEISDLMVHLKLQETQNETELKMSRLREIIKIGLKLMKLKQQQKNIQ
jgi:hypothetical protein